jgi:hypothetical protein
VEDIIEMEQEEVSVGYWPLKAKKGPLCGFFNSLVLLWEQSLLPHHLLDPRNWVS